MLFDLDDTLLNRDQAVEKLFSIILEKYYEDANHLNKSEMLKKFKEYDRSSYGYHDKTKVLESFFNEYPSKLRLPSHDAQEFWNSHFPHCFTTNPTIINIVKTIKMHAKVAIITNGTSLRQHAKILNTNLDSCFEVIIVSEEVGYSKPDKRIFDLALEKLNVEPETALFVGDDMEKDILGCQNARIKGIWFNPHRIKNETKIKPYAEITSFESLLDYVT